MSYSSREGALRRDYISTEHDETRMGPPPRSTSTESETEERGRTRRVPGNQTCCILVCVLHYSVIEAVGRW